MSEHVVTPAEAVEYEPWMRMSRRMVPADQTRSAKDSAEYEPPRLELIGAVTELTLSSGSPGMTEITPPTI